MSLVSGDLLLGAPKLGALACGEVLPTVNDNPFLHDLTPEQFDLISALFERISLPARTTVCRQGDRAVYMFLLQEGKVTIRYKPYDGPRIVLTHLHTGDVFGWSAVIGNGAYTSDAICTTPVQLLRAPGRDLRNLCAEYPAAGKSILEKLAVAVAPRWIHSRHQVESILRAEVFQET
jgi:CRP-like cAMP-binding protein